MLSSTLRKFEADGLVIREVFPEVPPKVVYELTPMGRSLYKLMEGLVDWVTQNWSGIKESRLNYK